jgi:tRNA threonylcarbamoyladenosine biosynthesis protein TsaE
MTQIEISVGERISTSPEMTHRLAAAMAVVALPGDLVCLWGELGAGKTVFAKGFGHGLGVRTTVNSPTFVLMAEHEGRIPLFHLDLYRLSDATDAWGGGLFDDRQSAGVTLVEWPERLGPALPATRLDVRIDGSGDSPRRIRFEAKGVAPRRYVAAAAAASIEDAAGAAVGG